MDTTEIPTPQPGCDGDPLASITERWADLLGCTKSMCALMRAFNSSIDIGYAPMGLGEQVWAELTTLGNLVDAARISITPAIVASGRWKTEGSKSPEDWLANKTGSSTGKARSQLEIGKNLRKAPGTQESFLNGEISAEQADTIADAVEANPAAEDDLLDQAKRDSLKNLKDEAARRKAEVEDIEERERRLHRKRYVRQWTDKEGAWNLRARGPIPTGSEFMAVLEGLIDQQFKMARKTGVRGTRDNYAYDALMDLANQHGWGTGTGNSGGTGPDSGPGGSGGGTGGGSSGLTGPTSAGGRGGARPTSPGDTGGGTAAPDPAATDGAAAEPAASDPAETGGPGVDGADTKGTRDHNDRTPTGAGTSSATGAEARGNANKNQAEGDPPGLATLFDVEQMSERARSPKSSGESSRSKPTRRPDQPVAKQRIFCVDWNALARGRAHTGERCELRGIGAVSVAEMRHTLLVSSARLVVTDADGRVVTVALVGAGAINGRIFSGRLSGRGAGRPALLENLEKEALQSAMGQRSTVIIRVRAQDLQGRSPAFGGNRDEVHSDADQSHQVHSHEVRSDQLHSYQVHVPGVGAVDRGRATDLLGAEALQRLVERGIAIRDFTYVGRAPSAAQRVALAWADTTCKVPGCHNQRVEIDHRHPWAADRVTELDNLDPLCGYHHDLKTREGWAFTTADQPQFVPPDDPNHPGPSQSSSRRTGQVG